METIDFSLLFMRILWAAGALLLFSIAVIVHEFGHFLAAKLLGFKVEAFSIGFGPAIWHKKVKGCDYRVSCIPLGGYVALPQLDPAGMDKIQGKNGDDADDAVLPPVAAWKRLVVAFAGPFGNLVLAAVIAMLIYLVPSDDSFGGVGVTVGEVEKNSAAEMAGLHVGDKFVSLNGTKVSFWTEVFVETQFSGNTNSGIKAVIDRGGKRIELSLPVELDEVSGAQLIPGISPRMRCQVGDFLTNSVAEAAGVRKGDSLIAINGIELNGPNDMTQRIVENGVKPFQLTLRRFSDGSIDVVTLVPAINAEFQRPMIGIVFANNESSIPQWLMYKRPWMQLKNDADSVFRMLRALFAPRTKGEAGRAARNVGGAGTLFFVFWMQVQAGLLHSVAFLRLLCVNLAILNLLPLPVLDGGHILFAVIEMITRRKPSAKFVSWISNVFAVLLILLMVVLLSRDAMHITKFVTSHSNAGAESAVSETDVPDSDGVAPAKAVEALQ